MNFKIFLSILTLILVISGCRVSPAVQTPQESPNDSNRADLGVKTEDNKQDQQADMVPGEEETKTPIVDEKPDPEEPEEVPQKEPEERADFVLYDVPFAPQAPFAVWDELHQEACEEASMIMVDRYLGGEDLSPHKMEQAILSLIKWQEQNGYKVDTTARETRDILKAYFNVNARVIEIDSVLPIIDELSKGNLVIIPAAGRQLGNPYFSGEGPIYHMLVIKGYDNTKKEFITNDPGTKRGESYRYNYNTLFNAIHDWNHTLAQGGMTDDEIAQGAKNIVVIEK